MLEAAASSRCMVTPHARYISGQEATLRCGISAAASTTINTTNTPAHAPPPSLAAGARLLPNTSSLHITATYSCQPCRLTACHGALASLRK
jgi:hypothetical protein